MKKGKVFNTEYVKQAYKIYRIYDTSASQIGGMSYIWKAMPLQRKQSVTARMVYVSIVRAI